MNCIDENMVEGGIFTKAFFSTYYFFYCSLSSEITQLTITNNQFQFQRQIPLY
jgi:hypothetical protein